MQYCQNRQRIHLGNWDIHTIIFLYTFVHYCSLTISNKDLTEAGCSTTQTSTTYRIIDNDNTVRKMIIEE